MSGSLRGEVVDLGVGGELREVTWKATTPPGTGVALFVRASNTPFAAEAVTPDWKALGSSPASTGLPAGSYVQWRAVLHTNNTAISPRLEGISCTVLQRSQP